MAYGRDIVIQLADASITAEDVRCSLDKFVSVTSISPLAQQLQPVQHMQQAQQPQQLQACLFSSTHVDHLLNVLSGKLRVGRFLCGFARPRDEADSEEEEDDETLVEDMYGSFHDAFLSPAKSAPIPIVVPVDTLSSVFHSPPSSPPLDEEEWCGGAMQTPRRGRPAGAGAAPATPLSSIPIGLHPEMPMVDPSPYRPGTRAPRVRVAELAEIYDKGVLEAPESSTRLVPNYESAAFLPLAPPYHLLPNTPYFRNAPIDPPPFKPALPVPTAQRIVNRYLSSMKVMDNLDEMEIQSLMCFNFNRTIGYCPYTMPEKAPLELGCGRDDDEDMISQGWSVWTGTLTEEPNAVDVVDEDEDDAANHHQRTRLTH